MKTNPLLLSALLAAALPCAAQEQPVPVNPAIAALPASPPKMPVGARLERAQFESAALSEIVEFLEAKEQEANQAGALNVVISPGLERRVLPSLNLRNVTTTEVLSIVTNLLGLQLEPVRGDDSDTVVAWLVKPATQTTAILQDSSVGGGGDLREATVKPGAEGGIRVPVAVPPAGELPGTAPGFTYSADAAVPHIAVVASGMGAGGMAASATPVKQSRVFGIAALLPPAGASDQERELRMKKQDELLQRFQQFAAEQDKDAEVRYYDGLDIIVVKSTAMPIIAEALEAMKLNSSARVASAREAADRDNFEIRKAFEAVKQANANLPEPPANLTLQPEAKDALKRAIKAPAKEPEKPADH